jgi:hypothetical protein
MVDWPTSLPQTGLNGASGGPQQNSVSFEPDIGPSIDRRRSSFAGRKIKVELPPITNAQYAIFVSFFEDDLYDGLLPFNFNDPMTQTTKSFKFVKTEPAYSEQRLTGDMMKISFELFRLN